MKSEYINDFVKNSKFEKIGKIEKFSKKIEKFI
jgi:hypothetical protein